MGLPLQFDGERPDFRKNPPALAEDNESAVSARAAVPMRCALGKLSVARNKKDNNMDAINTDVMNVSVPLGEDYPEIREGVRAICKKFPSEYWRKLEDNDDYAEEFVKELSDAGYLAAQIPEEYGGSGLPLRAGCAILEEINANGCHGGACHAQMYMMGMLLRHGTRSAEAAISARHCRRQNPLSGLRRHRADHGLRHHQAEDAGRTQGRQVHRQRPEDLDLRAHKSDLMTLLVRTTPLDQVKKRTEGLSVLLVEMKDAIGKGLTMQRIDTMINHQTNALFFDNLEVPAENLIGEEGQGFRYILTGMNSERLVAASQSSGDCRFFINKAVAYSRSAKCSAVRSARTRASSFRWRAAMPSGRQPI